LSSDSADGVRKVLEDITEELRWAMNFTGSYDVTHMDPAVIWQNNPNMDFHAEM
jgi:isopentenyl diphosphate isomerase/L-lactate dehydrogenase-like FMN-dependent dehydrogenase